MTELVGRFDSFSSDGPIEKPVGRFDSFSSSSPVVVEEPTKPSMKDKIFSSIDRFLDAPDQTIEALGSVSRGAGPKILSEQSDPLNAFESLFSLIEKGEGGYDASNRGTINDAIIGSDFDTKRDGKKLTEMTIGEIRAKQSIKDPNDANRLFAVGRFQVIPDTLEMAIKNLKLSDDTVFNQETQNKIGMYLVTSKRPVVGKYLSGKESVSVDNVMLNLAKEFASFPVPYNINVKRKGEIINIKKGNSYYGSGNKAQHTVEEVMEELKKLKGSA